MFHLCISGKRHFVAHKRNWILQGHIFEYSVLTWVHFQVTHFSSPSTNHHYQPLSNLTYDSRMQLTLHKWAILFLGLHSHVAQRYVLLKNIQNSNKSLPSRLSVNAFHACNQYIHYQWASLMGWHGSCLQGYCLPGSKDATIQPWRTLQNWFANKGQ